MNQQIIKQFNQKLVNDKIEITIVEYVKQVNELVYHIDIDFIDDFLNLVDKDECCIHHNLLEKYGVMNIKDTYYVKRVLEQYEFEEGKDYKISPPKSGGGLEYLLKPEIFKVISMRSRNTRKFADYYIFLEKCIKYYTEYEKLKLQEKINKLESTLNDRVIIPSCKHKIENLAIVYLEDEPEYQYYVIRGQIKHIRRQLKRLNKTEEDIIAAIDTPNSVDLWINIKEELDESLTIDKMIANNRIINTGYFALKNISEKEFIRRIEQINKEKFNY